MLAGVDLDAAVYDMAFYQAHLAGRRDRQDELRAIGFCWGRLQPEYNLVVEALIVFKERFGDLMVPSLFVVPRDDGWPDGCVGMPLGRRVRQIRERNDYLGDDLSRWATLEEMGAVPAWLARRRPLASSPLSLSRAAAAPPPRRARSLAGFVWSPREATRVAVDEALATYEVLYGTDRVPRSYVVADDDGRFPEKCRGLGGNQSGLAATPRL